MSSGEFSTPALFDLGNAWLQTGHPGWAILEYERALVLMPGDPALEQALVVARSRAGISVAPQGIAQHAAQVLGDDAWAWLALASLLALCVGLGWMRRAGGWTRTLILVGLCGLIMAADAIALRWPELDRAVVVGDTVARLAPAAGADAIFDLHQGQVVYLRGRFQAFERVRTADGRSGWASREAVVPVRVTGAEAAAEPRPAHD